ncbi:MAG: C40 family peptidase, partial [Actinomycetes bacterium]
GTARAAAGPSPARPVTGEPSFRGSQGWDATDHVYWYRRGGQWWWTSHREKYDRYAGGTGTAPVRSGSSGTTPAPVGSSTPSRGGTEAAISFAASHVGDPYVWGGDGPHGWDCSGLVRAAFQRAGISLPRVAEDQYRAATPITRSQLRRGDLVFWSADGSVAGIHHVAIYLGQGQYLEAPRPGKRVRVSSLDQYDPNLYARLG